MVAHEKSPADHRASSVGGTLPLAAAAYPGKRYMAAP